MSDAIQSQSPAQELPNLVIRSEADAYALLQQATEGTIQPWGNLYLEGWPNFTLYLKGPKFDQSITPPVMRSLLEFQKSIYQAYASARYDNPSKRLSDSEKRALEIQVRVEGGSSEFSFDAQALAIEFIKQMGSKMSSNDILIVVITFMVLYFGNSALRTFLDDRKEVRLKEVEDETQRKTLEVLQFTTEQETKRTALLTGVIARDAQLQDIALLAHNAKADLVKAVSTADEGRLGDVPLSGKAAITLVHNARREADEVRLDGRYRLLKLDWSNVSRAKVRVFNVDSGLELDAEVQDESLGGQSRTLLQQAEWDRSAVRLQINARLVGSEYRGAVILKVEADIATEPTPVSKPS